MTASTSRVHAYPFSPARALELDPAYAQLRAEESLSRVRMPFGEPGWLVTRAADVRLVMSDPRFSRELANAGDPPRLREVDVSGTGLLGMDPPDHARVRKIMAKVFTARRVETMREATQQTVDGLLDDLVAGSGDRVFDVVESLAFQIPSAVIGKLMGLEDKDQQNIKEWSQAIMSTAEGSEDSVREGFEALFGYVAELVATRRANPTDDLVGIMVDARDEGQRLSEEELATHIVGLITTGAETTSSQIPNFLYAILTHPDQLALLREDPALVPRAVEELLRWIPFNSAALFPRCAREDVELRGTTVRAGEYLLPSLSAANRDPAVFADPERLDITREHNPHIAFGHGAHHCVGAQLARLELQVMLGTMVRRFPELALADDPESVPWKQGLVRGPLGLRVTW
ncbi:cytochrome P450 [Kitasatospora sp. NPDC056181]|uniref:cytochrome P450 n=1 Tax=Kitasatospora sp. NPDC056181 TaxID=3345737 RepID=UPI0035D64D89